MGTEETSRGPVFCGPGSCFSQPSRTHTTTGTEEGIYTRSMLLVPPNLATPYQQVNDQNRAPAVPPLAPSRPGGHRNRPRHQEERRPPVTTMGAPLLPDSFDKTSACGGGGHGRVLHPRFGEETYHLGPQDSLPYLPMEADPDLLTGPPTLGPGGRFPVTIANFSTSG